MIENELKSQIPANTRLSQSEKTEIFNEELCNMMASANIPFSKLNNPCVRGFLEKYTTYNIPDESTLRKQYLPRISQISQITFPSCMPSTSLPYVSIVVFNSARIVCFVFGIVTVDLRTRNHIHLNTVL